MGKPPLVADADFNRFWARYPKRVAKLDALKAWKSLKPAPELVTQILEAVDGQRDSAAWRKDGGQFVPYPATWIRGGRWLDEAVEVNEAPLTPQELADARAILAKRFGRCAHEPACPDRFACVNAIAYAIRSKGNGQ